MEVLDDAGLSYLYLKLSEILNTKQDASTAVITKS